MTEVCSDAVQRNAVLVQQQRPWAEGGQDAAEEHRGEEEWGTSLALETP